MLKLLKGKYHLGPVNNSLMDLHNSLPEGKASESDFLSLLNIVRPDIISYIELARVNFEGRVSLVIFPFTGVATLAFRVTESNEYLIASRVGRKLENFNFTELSAALNKFIEEFDKIPNV
jgi:hypothetical protein